MIILKERAKIIIYIIKNITIFLTLLLFGSVSHANNSEKINSFIEVFFQVNNQKTREKLDNYNVSSAPRYKKTLDFIDRNLPSSIITPHFKVLELGIYKPLYIEYLLKFKNIKFFEATGGNPFSNIKYSNQVVFDRLSNGDFLKVINIDIQNEMLPYSKNQFDLVMLFEVLEHLPVDPMYTMAEINRVTKMGGLVIISTPNITSYRALLGEFTGYSPYLFSSHSTSRSSDRHNHEWSPIELKSFMKDAGFEIVNFETVNCYGEPDPDFVKKVKSIGAYDSDRGDTMILVAKKVTSVVNRFPDYLYYDAQKTKVDTNDYP